MKIEAGTDLGKRTKVFDAIGRKIRMITSYDTDTKEATFIPSFVDEKGKERSIVVKENGRNTVLKITKVLEGSYAEVDGKRIQ
jgi:hypothetical protein